MGIKGCVLGVNQSIARIGVGTSSDGRVYLYSRKAAMAIGTLPRAISGVLATPKHVKAHIKGAVNRLLPQKHLEARQQMGGPSMILAITAIEKMYQAGTLRKTKAIKKSPTPRNKSITQKGHNITLASHHTYSAIQC